MTNIVYFEYMYKFFLMKFSTVLVSSNANSVNFLDVK